MDLADTRMDVVVPADERSASHLQTNRLVGVPRPVSDHHLLDIGTGTEHMENGLGRAGGVDSPVVSARIACPQWFNHSHCAPQSVNRS